MVGAAMINVHKLITKLAINDLSPDDFAAAFNAQLKELGDEVTAAVHTSATGPAAATPTSLSAL